MNQSDKKCVMVIDANLPLGVIANTSAILGVSIGKQAPQAVGRDVLDASGKTHPGIITVPITVLKGDEALLKNLRAKLYEPEYAEMQVVDFSNVAQSCNVYEEYVASAAETPEREHTYYGVATYGDKKKVNRLTGYLPLLRA